MQPAAPSRTACGLVLLNHLHGMDQAFNFGLREFNSQPTYLPDLIQCVSVNISWVRNTGLTR